MAQVQGLGSLMDGSDGGRPHNESQPTSASGSLQGATAESSEETAVAVRKPGLHSFKQGGLQRLSAIAGALEPAEVHAAHCQRQQRERERRRPKGKEEAQPLAKARFGPSPRQAADLSRPGSSRRRSRSPRGRHLSRWTRTRWIPGRRIPRPGRPGAPPCRNPWRPMPDLLGQPLAACLGWKGLSLC